MQRIKSMLLPKIVEDVEGIGDMWPEMKVGVVCAKNLNKIVVAARQNAEFNILKI